MNPSQYLTPVRSNNPLVHCITNYVTVNDCANILLAAGASPIMSHNKHEVAELVAAANALVLNMGTIEDLDAMLVAGKEANRLQRPVILDPVAAGGTSLRLDAVHQLMNEIQFAAIRGNASEIKAIAFGKKLGSGVDVSTLDQVTKENLPQAVEIASMLAQKTGSVIAISGAMDIVTDGSQHAIVHNGCATMARITGSGCMLTSLIGAFCAGASESNFEATVAAMAAMGLSGELADARRLENGTGNASFRTDLIDAMFNLTEQVLDRGARIEMV
ncbi:hydroxyethylthiazole kinase [Paenibacillus massiliensis]|uniref:hydroxyethylthiazole kinase n=1 Tax=Paenibacillus massiliensis TaxID=225917 RepID=UPI0003FBFD1B|nr:hydroxyethylthiazole kinase [Paenibacillus massiliensis]